MLEPRAGLAAAPAILPLPAWRRLQPGDARRRQRRVTLAHESWHLRGILDEARTQCYAVQTAETVARSLGVAADDARAIAVRVAADDARAPAGEYHSADCRPGGLYDLRPDTPDWPSG